MRFIFKRGGKLLIILFTSFFANSCHNGFTNVSSQATGQIAWSKSIADSDSDPVKTRLLLSTGKVVVVDGVNHMFAFDHEGTPLWQRSKWSGTPVILKEGWIYYSSASRKDRMEAIDLSNQVQLEDFEIPAIGDDSYLVLFEPDPNGLIAQVQYIGAGRRGKAPDNFIVYKIHKGGLGYDWSKRYNGQSPLIPLFNQKNNSLLTTTPNEVLVFDINSKQRDPQPLTFPLPLENTLWVSCGDDDQLYWAGLEEGQTVLAVTDFKGEGRWRWESERHPRLKLDKPVAPPIVTPNRAYLLSQKNLVAIKDGKLLWSFEAREGDFTSATALADGSVLVVEGRKLHRVDAQGKSLFEVSIEEAIVTSPVIDEDGHIYVASSETLYAIH